MNEEAARIEILQGLQQVDSTFAIIELSTHTDTLTRKATIKYKAQNSTGSEVSGEVEIA
jgi:hypothetical protein